MKIIDLLLTVLFLSIAVSFGFSSEQQPKKTNQTKAGAALKEAGLKQDSVPGYAIQVNGEANSITINNQKIAPENSAADQAVNDSLNNISISGKGNSVSIQQENKAGKVSVKQTGSNNRVNITQTK